MSSARVDVHHHILPEFYIKAVKEKGVLNPLFFAPQWNLDYSKRCMETLGVDFAITSVPPEGPLIFEHDREKCRQLARQLNDYSAQLIRENPKSLGFFATLPSFIDVEGVLEEINYAHHTLQADGFIIFTSYDHGKKYLGHKTFEPIWARLNELQAVVLIHPKDSCGCVAVSQPTSLVDFPTETTRTAYDLVMSGVRTKYSASKVILPHAGGTLPYLADRFSRVNTLGAPVGLSQEQIVETFKGFYFDTAWSSSVPTLNALMSFADCNKIVYGSDGPFATTEVTTAMARGLDEYFATNPELLVKINRANAKALFPTKIL